MDVPISNSLRVTFLVHLIVALVFGAALFLIPGRMLTLIGWVPEEIQIQAPEETVTVPGTSVVSPVFTRLWGVALLALGYGSFLGWRASRREQVTLLVNVEFVYCVLGVLAFLLTMFARRFYMMPVAAWVIFAILIAFAVAWGLALRR